MTLLPTDAAELAKYYYVIADASEEKILQLTDAEVGLNGESDNDYKAMKYVDVNDPLHNQGDLWIIEHTTEGYHIRSMAYSGLLMQLEYNAPKYRRTHDQPHACTWTKLNFNYTDAGWQIESGTYTGNYFGYWDKKNNQYEISSGKQNSDIGNYTIYAIKRTTYFENYYKNAVKDADGGVDVTNLIVNPQLMTVKAQYRGQIEGYSITYTGSHAAPAINVDKCEFWKKDAANLTFDISQTVNLPNGKYSLTGTMFCSGYSGGTVGVYAQNEYTPITEDSQTAKDYTVENVAVTDETLTFGYKTVDNPVVGWFVGTGFKLTYYGEDVQAYIDALNSTISVAENITPSASDAANKALTEAIVAAKAKTSETTSEALIEANNVLKAAVEKYNAYILLKETLDKYSKKNWTNTEFADYDEAESMYESATTEPAEVKTIVDGMRDKYRQYLREVVKEYKTATSFVKNATYKDGDDATHPGWSNIDNAYNKQVSGNLDSYDGSGKYMENWNGSLNVGDIKQTVSNLPAGKYFLKMSAHTRGADAKDYIYIKSGDQESHGAMLVPEKPSITITDPIEITDGTVEIGIHVGSGCDWVVWNYVELYAYSVDNQVRKVPTGKYGTVCLPYNATVEGATLYDAAVNAAKNEVNLTEVTGDIEAGKAYIYLATADEQTFTFANTDMVKDPTAGTLTGVFATQQATEGTYVLQMDEEGTTQKFYKVADVKPTLGAYRAYLTVPTESAAKALTISFGNPTAVDAVKALTEGEDAVIYDLTGKRLSKLQRGVNIVNGVKVIVK